MSGPLHSSPSEDERPADPTAKVAYEFHRFLKASPAGSTCLPHYLAQLERELSPEMLWRLVVAEFEYRQAAGEPVSMSDYFERFPELKEVSLDTLQPTSPGGPAAAKSTGKSASRTSVRRNRTTEPWSAGQTIDDFELLARLGRGGFATVFLARQKSMQRLVALKIAKDLGSEPQTLAQLDHPHIVRVYDQRAVPEEGVFLLYMQYVAGGSLQDLLASVKGVPLAERTGKTLVDAIDRAVVDRGDSPSHLSPMRQRLARMSWTAAVCELGRQLARALDYARQQNVLHRDIKPGNILIGSDCVAKLVDFNISYWVGLHGADPRAQFGGSLAYMSPEQLRAFNPDESATPEQLDHRSDLFSLGVVLFELWTGRKPFSTQSSRDSWTDQLRELTETRSDISSQIEQLEPTHDPADRILQSALKKCLAHDPNDRFQTPGELATHLEIAVHPRAVPLLYPPRHQRTSRLAGGFLWISLLVAGLVNLLGVFFVREFNLLQSIPQTHQATFWVVQRVFNWTAFPLALVIYVWLSRHGWQGMRRMLNDEPMALADVLATARAVIHSGNRLALICATEWIVAGVLYPIVLRAVDVPLEFRQGVDFALSHALAGISIMSATFFSLSWLALRYWLPVILRDRFAPTLLVDVRRQLEQARRSIAVYQVLAVVVPSLAIALLVIAGDARNKFALSVISLAGLVIVPFVYLAAHRTRDLIEVYQSLAQSDSRDD